MENILSEIRHLTLATLVVFQVFHLSAQTNPPAPDPSPDARASYQKVATCEKVNPDLNTWLNNSHGRASIRFTSYDYNFYNKPVQYIDLPVNEPNPTREIPFLDGKWNCKYRATVPSDRSDALEVEFNFKLTGGSSPQTSVSIDFTFDNWSKSNSVLSPGSA